MLTRHGRDVKLPPAGAFVIAPGRRLPGVAWPGFTIDELGSDASRAARSR
jgi:hypothetical protein